MALGASSVPQPRGSALPHLPLRVAPEAYGAGLGAGRSCAPLKNLGVIRVFVPRHFPARSPALRFVSVSPGGEGASAPGRVPRRASLAPSAALRCALSYALKLFAPSHSQRGVHDAHRPTTPVDVCRVLRARFRRFAAARCVSTTPIDPRARRPTFSQATTPVPFAYPGHPQPRRLFGFPHRHRVAQCVRYTVRRTREREGGDGDKPNVSSDSSKVGAGSCAPALSLPGSADFVPYACTPRTPRGRTPLCRTRCRRLTSL